MVVTRIVEKSFNMKLMNNLRIVYYHLLSEKAEEYYPAKNTISLRNFENQLIYLKKKFEIIKISEAYNRYLEGDNLKKCLVISTDDGFSTNFEMCKILDKHNCKSIHFVNNDCIDNKHINWRHALFILEKNLSKRIDSNLLIEKIAGHFEISLPNQKESLMNWSLRTFPYEKRESINNMLWSNLRSDSIEEYLLKNKLYLSSDEINHMLEMGHEIGSHTFSHPELSKISQREIVFEVEESIKNLNERFKIKSNAFSFPFGRDNQSTDIIINNCPSVKIILGISEKINSNIKSPLNWERTNLEYKNINKFKFGLYFFPLYLYFKSL